MVKKKNKKVSFETMVKLFMRTYKIPTKDDVKKLIARIERLEELISRSSKRSGKSRKTLTDKSGTGTRLVWEIVSSAKDEISFSQIQSQTGFNDRKLRNIIYRLSKHGKIKNIRRGVYAASTEKG